MNEQEKKEQNYIAKVPDKKNLSSKPMKGAPAAKKFKGKPDLRNNNSKGTNGMHNGMPLNNMGRKLYRSWTSNSANKTG